MNRAREAIVAGSGIDLHAAPPLPLPGLSFVVPVYNSEALLPTLVQRVASVGVEVASDFELILVNDGSRDQSWITIEKLAATHTWIIGIDMMRNYGQHNALLCGIRAARYAVVATLDDDLQNPPEEVPKLLEKLAEGYDVIYGTPEREQHGLWRDLASQVTKIVLQKAMGAATARHVSAFRVFRTGIREAFRGYSAPYVSIDVLLTWGTARFAAVPVRHAPRAVGNSGYTFGRLLTHTANMMTGFSTWPLQFASLVGFSFTLLGFALGLYVVAGFFIHGQVVPGFAFIASIVSLFSGAQLFALGIFGEYLARMHFRMMDRPTYAVRREQRTRDS